MNWNGIASLMEGQGTVFWAAVAAASLGLALLVAAAAAHLRGRLAAWRRRPRRSVRRPAAAPAPLVARATADGYAPAEAADPDGPSDGLGQLQARLRAAGDRLAELGRIEGFRESPLKAVSQDVDYVFRKGVG